jgi:trans-feruloyl-CoA hydratase/vanillin synthase
MGAATHHEMRHALTHLTSTPTIKLLTLTGEGQAFCAGMNLEQCFLEPYEDPNAFDALHASSPARRKGSRAPANR